MAQTTAKAVADYIIRFSQEHGDLVTNLKLQKLVYYAQAWYLALYDKLLSSPHALLSALAGALVLRDALL